MVDMTNCPICGAVITGPQCEYCGTRFRLYSENELVAAKTKALANAEEIKVLYEEAIKAMRRHSF